MENYVQISFCLLFLSNKFILRKEKLFRCQIKSLIALGNTTKFPYAFQNNMQGLSLNVTFSVVSVNSISLS